MGVLRRAPTVYDRHNFIIDREHSVSESIDWVIDNIDENSAGDYEPTDSRFEGVIDAGKTSTRPLLSA